MSSLPLDAPSTVAVLDALDSAGGYRTPRELARTTDYSRRTCQYALDALLDRGLVLRRKRRSAPTRKPPYEYVLRHGADAAEEVGA